MHQLTDKPYGAPAISHYASAEPSCSDEATSSDHVAASSIFKWSSTICEETAKTPAVNPRVRAKMRRSSITLPRTAELAGA